MNRTLIISAIGRGGYKDVLVNKDLSYCKAETVYFAIFLLREDSKYSIIRKIL